MKIASRFSPSFTVRCCISLLALAAGACGSEAPPPTVNNSTTGGQSNSAGNAAQPTSGTGGIAVSSNGGSAGTTTVGGGGASSAGMAAVGGTSSAAGTAGTGGANGGTSSTGGSGGGTGGAASVAGTGGGGADLVTTVGAALTGQMLLGPCLGGDDPLVCQTSLATCPPDNKTDFALSGILTTDREITLGGDPNVVYTITLHVQGEVEAKSYGTTGDQEKSKASPMADGFQTGGTPGGGDAYN